jgi:hypothetical protein
MTTATALMLDSDAPRASDFLQEVGKVGSALDWHREDSPLLLARLLGWAKIE